MNAPVVESPKLVASLPYLIEQDWAGYTLEQHAIWSELVTKILLWLPVPVVAA